MRHKFIHMNDRMHKYLMCNQNLTDS